jgi:hypothetical protein
MLTRYAKAKRYLCEFNKTRHVSRLHVLLYMLGLPQWTV